MLTYLLTYMYLLTYLFTYLNNDYRHQYRCRVNDAFALCAALKLKASAFRCSQNSDNLYRKLLSNTSVDASRRLPQANRERDVQNDATRGHTLSQRRVS